MSKIEEQLINKLRSRAAAGQSKYGTTMERTDLTNAEWLQHLQEELLDAAVYVEKLLTLIEAYEEGSELKNQKAMNYSLVFIFNNNEAEADELLKSYGYKKIGHKKINPVGFCISFNDKKYWPISNALNPLIDKIDNLQILRDELKLEF